MQVELDEPRTSSPPPDPRKRLKVSTPEAPRPRTPSPPKSAPSIMRATAKPSPQAPLTPPWRLLQPLPPAPRTPTEAPAKASSLPLPPPPLPPPPVPPSSSGSSSSSGPVAKPKPELPFSRDVLPKVCAGPSPISQTDLDWNDPRIIDIEKAITFAYGRSFKDRGPPPPSEGGPDLWRGQVFREKSGRWGNRGGKRRAEFDAKYGAGKNKGKGTGKGNGKTTSDGKNVDDRGESAGT